MSFGANYAWLSPDDGLSVDQHGHHSVVGGFQVVPRPANLKMADEITRPELDAKLELIETRMDGRIQTIEHHISTMLKVNEQLVDETQQSRREAKHWSIGVIATVLTTTVALLIGVWQIVAGVTQSNIAWFESGRGIGVQQATPPSKAEPKK